MNQCPHYLIMKCSWSWGTHFHFFHHIHIQITQNIVPGKATHGRSESQSKQIKLPAVETDALSLQVYLTQIGHRQDLEDWEVCHTASKPNYRHRTGKDDDLQRKIKYQSFRKGGFWSDKCWAPSWKLKQSYPTAKLKATSNNLISLHQVSS